jgi:rubrerythrin
MADGTSDAVESATLEGPAAAWLGERADELGIEPSELLKRVVAAYRSVEDGDLAADVITREDAEALLENALASRVEDRLAAVEDRVDAAEDDFDGKLQDVRERVVQVKREADGKADADHDHPELAADVEDAMAELDDVAAETADLAEEVAAVSDHVDRGFENFEEVLTYLRDEVDDLHTRTTALASAVLSIRESVQTLGAAEMRRARAERIQREATLSGVEHADCEDCGQTVAVGQLTAPECPFCGAAFEDVQPKDGWFGSHTLATGSTPALPSGRSWLDDEDSESDLLGGETDSLEEMAADEDADEGVDSGGESVRATEDGDHVGTEPVDADIVGEDDGGEDVDVVDADVVDVEDTGPMDATDQRAHTESDGGDPGNEEATDG